MEEYIYILLGVLWLAATIYRASKKKKQQAPPPRQATDSTEKESRVSTTQSLLEQLLDGQHLRIPEPEVSAIDEEYAEPMLAEVEERKKDKSYQTKYEGYGFQSLESVMEEGVRSLEGIAFDDIMKQHEKKKGSAVRVNLRKAIIYKAILERPYT